jgi:hypothetical protein
MQLAHTLARGATAPIRLGLSAGGLGLSVARTVVDEARRALGHGGSSANGWSGPRPAPVRSPAPDVRAHGDALESVVDVVAPSPPRPSAPEAAAPPPVQPPAAKGPSVPAIPPVRGAKQVDDTPVPVAEFAEPGAEDGAGAQIHIDPPWDGYDGMTAAQIRERLASADSGVAAAVSLYESAGRGRVSVVRAADSRLRSLAS